MNIPKIKPILLASLVLIPTAAAQDVTVEAPKKELQAAGEREKKIQQEERAKALLEKKPVLYSGFLLDAARAERKSRLFSLKAPRDPKNDYRNISFDERSGRPKGFVLFRLEF
jgi:hypothetical protein